MRRIIALLLIFCTIPVFSQYKPDYLRKKALSITDPSGVKIKGNDIYKLIGPDEYSKYQSAVSLAKWGIGVSSVGLGGVLFGTIQGSNAVKNATDTETKYVYHNQAVSVIAVSGAVLLTGGILFIVGNSKLKRVVDKYNISIDSDGVAFCF